MTDGGPALWRVGPAGDGAARWARGPVSGPVELLVPGFDLDDLLARPAPDLAAALRTAQADGPVPAGWQPYAPVGRQDVWASGVTFERSREARNEESGDAPHYDRVYSADRPELFFKAAAGTARGPDAPVNIRADSQWDVPEPELGLLLAADGSRVGYLVGNDVSSRSIEGENPLYLPQAKVYEGSCALGPCVVPVADVPDLGALTMGLTIDRGGRRLFADTVSLSRMRRAPGELADWLFRALAFPTGVVLLTGTAIVPPAEFTLAPGDEVAVSITALGTLRNRVELLDTGATVRPDRADPPAIKESA